MWLLQTGYIGTVRGNLLLFLYVRHARLSPSIMSPQQRLSDDILIQVAQLLMAGLPPADARRLLSIGRIFLFAGLACLYQSLNLDCSTRTTAALRRVR
jgi:hypothetical protein